jgi:hypothetical protein
MQQGVLREHLSAVSSTERALQKVLELASYLMVMIWQNPDDFSMLVAISFGAVCVSALLFTTWALTIGTVLDTQPRAPPSMPSVAEAEAAAAFAPMDDDDAAGATAVMVEPMASPAGEALREAGTTAEKTGLLSASSDDDADGMGGDGVGEGEGEGKGGKDDL